MIYMEQEATEELRESKPVKIPPALTAQHIQDMSDADLGDLLGGYFAENPQAMNNLRNIMRDNQPDMRRDAVKMMRFATYAERLALHLIIAAENRDGDALREKVEAAEARAELEFRMGL
jgi:hypothetical protein